MTASMTASFRFPWQRYGFRKFTMEDRELLECHLADISGILSSYTCFSSLILWDDWTRVYCRENGSYLCLLLEEGPSDQWQVMPPLGPYDEEHFEELSALFLELEQMFQENGLSFSCCEIKDWMLPYLRRMSLQWEFYYGRENSDYLYRKEDFCKALENPKVRYNIRYLLRKSNPTLTEFRQEDAGLYVEVLEKVFCDHHSCGECTEGCQKKVLLRTLANHERLGIYGFLVSVGDRPVGYTAVARVGDSLIYQALKQVHGIRGLAEWMREQALLRYGDNIRLINYTEDMGREGLRRHKQNLAVYQLSHNYECETAGQGREEGK